MEYKLLSDEELIKLANDGDSEAMESVILRYRQLVTAIAHSYFLSNGDTEDLVQLGQIAVFKAITTFNGKAEFKFYVYKCIKNAVITAIKNSNALKNQPLNNYISLTGYFDDSQDKNELFADDKSDPEQSILNSESESELNDKIRLLLSKYENEILSLYLKGYSYTEIGVKLNKNTKSIDNALQRIKSKLLVLLSA